MREVRADAVGLEGAADIDGHLRVAKNVQREGFFRGIRKHERSGRDCCRALARLGEDRRDARVRVLKVRPGVAFESDHAVEVEHIILGEIAGEIRVLHSSDADGGSDARQLGGRHSVRGRVGIGGATRDFSGAAFAGLIKEILEREVLARACFQRFFVGAEHGAETEMDER